MSSAKKMEFPICGLTGEMWHFLYNIIIPIPIYMRISVGKVRKLHIIIILLYCVQSRPCIYEIQRQYFAYSQYSAWLSDTNYDQRYFFGTSYYNIIMISIHRNSLCIVIVV